MRLVVHGTQLHAGPKGTGHRGAVKRGRCFVELTGVMRVARCGGIYYGTVFVDKIHADKASPLSRKQNDSTAAFRSFIADVATRADLNIRDIRTDERREFQVQYLGAAEQSWPPRTNAHTPYTPRYKGDAERGL